MRLTAILERVWKRGQNPNESSSTAHSAEQRDRSSMADFVRILQSQDGNKSS
jgi:hypothetical protein